MHEQIVRLTKKQHFTQGDDLLLSEWSLTVDNTPSLATCKEKVLRCYISKSDKQTGGAI